MINIFFLFLLSTITLAQQDARLMDVDLSSFCEDQIREQEQESLDLQKRETCEAIKELEGRSIDPISMTKKDEEGNEWRLRFHFGFTRTDYHKTDLNI